MGNPILNPEIESITYELVDTDLDEEHQVLYKICGSKEYRNLTVRVTNNYKK